MASFVVLSLVFIVVERFIANARRMPWNRKGFLTDLLYWFLTPLVTKTITRVAMVLPALMLVVILGVSAEELKSQTYRGFGPLSVQPLWLQAVEIFVLGDFIEYWVHRVFHRGRWWPFHAVHHSSVEVDWLSSVRVHPVNDLVNKMTQVFPLLFMGFNPYVLAAYAPALTLYAIFLHANVNWDFGPFRAVVASPVFHRWHHTKEEEAMDKNFAGFFPFWDILFGTYYMPKDRWPQVFGIHDPMPEGIAGQLAYPFRSAGPVPAPEGARRVV